MSAGCRVVSLSLKSSVHASPASHVAHMDQQWNEVRILEDQVDAGAQAELAAIPQLLQATQTARLVELSVNAKGWRTCISRGMRSASWKTRSMRAPKLSSRLLYLNCCKLPRLQGLWSFL